MDLTMDADLPHRFKQWKRQVRNEVRLLMAGDSSKGEAYACTMVLCLGMLKDCQMLKEKECTAEHIIQLALRAEYRKTANTRMSKNVNSSSASTALQDIMSGSTTHVKRISPLNAHLPTAAPQTKVTLG
ncbi:hypothetical protein CAPTEDRAFT_213069 [Capitella teleta]|uniref:Uncharacterized protein n=1 Tax=Capitella teleta TaxID=283909 RepID=R7T4B9_CAPTE|nr:hypothetical protein CAPTEDRAFT_213069 [Capitella teleta]|eukprot:ELT87713.1 hypothetical protein CAPTEDRAFT_213069 [Capitella teleta]